MKTYLSLGIILAGLICNPAHSKIYQWTDEEGHTHFSDRPPPNTEHTERPNSARRGKATVHSATDGARIALDIQELLTQQKFIELNSRLSSLDSAVSEDIRFEEDLLRAYAAFDVENGEIEIYLDRWVEATPDHYAPYLARALYHYSMGWKARGSNYASDTSSGQLQGMKARFELAKSDIHQALSRNNEPLLIYSVLMDIEITMGSDRAAKAMMESGLDVHPLSFTIRSRYLRSLIPRWGGSYEAMSIYIQGCQENANKNPRLELLKGYVHADIGDMEMLQDNYATAVQRYTQALSYGDHSGHYYQRAKAYYWQGKYDSALTDIQHAIAIESGRAVYHAWYSRILLKQSRMDEAIDSVNMAHQLDPGLNRVTNQRERLARQLNRLGYEHGQAYDYQEAVHYHQKALELVPDDAETYYRLAWSHRNLHQTEQAISNVDKAIRLNPDNINYFVFADRILAHDKKWDEIIDYWDIFIERHPNVSRAYFERGGTHYHNGDMQSALADLKKASELGDPRASELYHRLSGD